MEKPLHEDSTRNHRSKSAKVTAGTTHTAGSTSRRSREIVGAIVISSGAFAMGLLGAWVYGLTDQKFEHNKGDITASQQVVMQESEVVANVARSASPSVVSIVTDVRTFGGFATEGAGTGVIISKDGYILTNKHVLPAGTQTVNVVTADDEIYENVQIVGSDPLNDLAFLKIPAVDDLPAAEIGDSSKMAIGQKVIAIGNALGQYETTVTSGIISGKGRPVAARSGGEVESLTNLFQTDAAINPGNSGGPLLNIAGQVIGINTAVAEEAEGIGFAIPINDAKGIIKSVLETGKVKRPYLGVQYITLTTDVAKHYNLSVKQGAYLPKEAGSVVLGGPAAKAGLAPGDIITRVNDTKLSKQTALPSVISQFSVGETVTLTVLRDGQEREIRVTLEEYEQN